MLHSATDPSRCGPDITAEKAALRLEMLAQRQILKASNPDASNLLKDQICLNIEVGKGLIVAGYVAIRDELDLEPALHALQLRGAILVLPVADRPGKELHFRHFRVGEALESGPYGTCQPGPSAKALIPDIVLAPLLAFDKFGHRLGFGGGYYDRTLAGLRKAKRIAAYGIGFDGQQVDTVPHGSKDVRLDGIMTPTRFIASEPQESITQ
jgi:5-formyltetrahydrofolate cyclo-ligase